jgi:hypothetical protein
MIKTPVFKKAFEECTLHCASFQFALSQPGPLQLSKANCKSEQSTGTFAIIKKKANKTKTILERLQFNFKPLLHQTKKPN